MSRIDPAAWRRFTSAVGVAAPQPSVEGAKVRSAASLLMRATDKPPADEPPADDQGPDTDEESPDGT